MTLKIGVVLVLSVFSLSACHKAIWSQEADNYDLKDSQLEERRAVNEDKPYPKLGTVPDRSFDYTSVEEFKTFEQDLNQDRGDSLDSSLKPNENLDDDELQDQKLDQARAGDRSADPSTKRPHKGPFILDYLPKVLPTHKIALARTLETADRDEVLTPEDRQFFKEFGRLASKTGYKVVVIAYAQDTHVFEQVMDQKLKSVIDELMAEQIPSNHIYFGSSLEMVEREDQFPSLDRMVDGTIKIFYY